MSYMYDWTQDLISFNAIKTLLYFCIKIQIIMPSKLYNFTKWVTESGHSGAFCLHFATYVYKKCKLMQWNICCNHRNKTRESNFKGL